MPNLQHYSDSQMMHALKDHLYPTGSQLNSGHPPSLAELRCEALKMFGYSDVKLETYQQQDPWITAVTLKVTDDIMHVSYGAKVILTAQELSSMNSGVSNYELLLPKVNDMVKQVVQGMGVARFVEPMAKVLQQAWEAWH